MNEGRRHARPKLSPKLCFPQLSEVRFGARIQGVGEALEYWPELSRWVSSTPLRGKADATAMAP